MLILRLICAFRENFRVLMKKTAFRRRIDIKRSPGRANRKTQKDARPCSGAARPCCSGRSHCTGARPHARPCVWPCVDAQPVVHPMHDHAAPGGAGFKWFRRFLQPSFLLLFLWRLERDFREFFRVSLGLWIHAFGLNFWRFKDCSTFKHQFIQVCLPLLFSLIFVFRNLLVLACLFNWMLGFVFLIWL